MTDLTLDQKRKALGMMGFNIYPGDIVRGPAGDTFLLQVLDLDLANNPAHWGLAMERLWLFVGPSRLDGSDYDDPPKEFFAQKFYRDKPWITEIRPTIGLAVAACIVAMIESKKE